MKMRLLFLGDIHGNFNLINQYIKLYELKDCHIIQVGDFGVGFNTLEKEKRALKMVHDECVKHNIFVWAIRGNHDYKPYFDNDPFEFTNIKLVKDYEILELEGKRILCVGGAVSVDRSWRYTKEQRNGNFEVKPGQTWWSDEIFVLDRDKIIDMKDINIVVTHTSPDYCPIDNTFGFGPFVESIIKEKNDTELRTDLLFERQQMTEMFHLLRLNGNDITHHMYGHFHKSDTINMNGIKHRLLGIGELFEERD
jgi:predicted phosphodiesterase